MIQVKHPNTGDMQSVRMDARAVRSLTLGYTASARSRQGMPSWPADILALYRGEYQAAAKALLRNSSSVRSRTASYFVLDCASGISRERKGQLDADPAVAVLGDINELYRASCPVWDVDLGDDYSNPAGLFAPCCSACCCGFRLDRLGGGRADPGQEDAGGRSFRHSKRFFHEVNGGSSIASAEDFGPGVDITPYAEGVHLLFQGLAKLCVVDTD